ncbi:MAG: hypothetical protein JNK63_01280 [Chthonomonas sp.]|nr:hypothetical protein [Chthonomonas sp.]
MSSLAPAQDTPVTQAEADVAIRKVYGHLRQVLNLPQAKFTPSQSKTPITRDQLVSRLSALHEYISERIQLKVRPTNADLKGLAPGLSEQRRRDIKTLVMLGLVSPEGLLVKSPQNQYTPRELGTILGVFLTRAMDITHELDPKFSPELMPN